jgi:serine/threonine protein kinase/HAMP domain-containing protein
MSAALRIADRQRDPGSRSPQCCGIELLLLRVVLFMSVILCVGGEYPKLELPLQEPVRPFNGPWEYRYGESPLLADGRPAWSVPDLSIPGWHQTTKPWNIAGRPPSGSLWLRTKVAASPKSELIICFPKIDDAYELYIDGYLHTKSASAGLNKITHYDGGQVLFLRIPISQSRHDLVFKIDSHRKAIGISAPLIGGGTDLYIYVLKKYQFDLSIGLFILGIGFIGGIIFSLRRERSYLYFSFLCWSLGAYISVTPSAAISIIFPYPSFWWELEVISLYCIGISVTLFFKSIFGHGPLGLTKWILYSYLTIGAVLLLFVSLSIMSTAHALPYIQVAFLVIFAYFSSYSMAIAIVGNIDARIFGIGFLIAMLPATYHLLTSLGLIRGQISSGPFSAVVIVITNVVVMARRFRVISKRVQDYSSMLQISLSTGGKLDEAELAQLAIKKILKALPIASANIYIIDPNQQTPRLLASGYDTEIVSPKDEGNSGSNLEIANYKQELVSLALEKGKTIEGMIPTPQRSGEAGKKPMRNIKYALATLLVTQEQTIGALCAELQPGRESLSNDDMDLLNGLTRQVAMSILTSRAGRLAADSVVVQSRMTKQQELLQAAARLARGDLDTKISTQDPHEFGQLASALEEMRQDLKKKIQTLESNNREIRELNDELRRQIDQRSRRVLDWALSTDDKRPQRGSHFPPDSMIGNYYKVVRLLGQGSMGSVYEVERTADNRRLAAKVLTARADRSAMIRFVREAQLLARLVHPNLVSIVDVDVNEHGILYIVMELIQGRTLKNCKEEYANLPQTLSILYQIAFGLSAVHLAGIVHRDLKPANVVIEDNDNGKQPLVKLVDFGFSTLSRGNSGNETASSRRSLTSPLLTGEVPIVTAQRSLGKPGSGSAEVEPLALGSVIVGTPMYMAPECRDHIQGSHPASDIFSFGVLAYELLTGEMPFATPPMTMDAEGNGLSFRSLRDMRPDLAYPLADLLDRTLSYNQMERPHAVELADMLVSLFLAISPTNSSENR